MIEVMEAAAVLLDQHATEREIWQAENDRLRAELGHYQRAVTAHNLRCVRLCNDGALCGFTPSVKPGHRCGICPMHLKADVMPAAGNG